MMDYGKSISITLFVATVSTTLKVLVVCLSSKGHSCRTTGNIWEVSQVQQSSNC